MFVKPGAKEALMKNERRDFLKEEWPEVLKKIRRLGLNAEDLLNGKKEEER
jgi:GntR family transcriptional regulator